ncbi:PHP domain-containing protein [Naasia aerilata]|uniref:Histidinol-phosphatase n=1 Tax=Naasia aerilata TaxID=1162966 RepID=A0ABM8GEJ7_9MICO|nr:PHP domain-containing protein [Naasia aerilata]BDZ46743.1 histidinol-phosphatase [Naasia aerilata]
MALPADGHVHSQWSWDARFGDMDATCARAVALGIPAVAFTEHVDFTPFRAGYLVDSVGPLVTDGILTAPPLDVEGYLESVERCRLAHPELRILTGMEVGQPHRHRDEVAALLATGAFERILGSLHVLPDGDAFAEPFELFRHRPADPAYREYLGEIPLLVAASEGLTALAHIDYPVRSWPEEGVPFSPAHFEEELRFALRAVADGELALEINTKVPLDPAILGWWREEGGRRVTFGSDAHEPEALGRGLADAAALAEAQGFRPDRNPEDPWIAAV